MLGDVPEPRPVGQALEEPAGAAKGAGVIAEARQEVDQRVVEAGQGVRRPVLQRAEIDQHPDGRFVGPEVGPPEDLGLEDLQIGSGRRFFGLGLTLRPLALRTRLRARSGSAVLA